MFYFSWQMKMTKVSCTYLQTPPRESIKPDQNSYKISVAIVYIFLKGMFTLSAPLEDATRR